MERLELFFPPRLRHLPLKVPSRVTEGVLYIRLFAYTVYARVMNGIAAGAVLTSVFLEKAARAWGGSVHGGKISAPSKIVSSKFPAGTAAGGCVPAAAEKKAAAYGGALHGALMSGEADRYAGVMAGGIRGGEAVTVPGLEKTAFVWDGKAHGGEMVSLRESCAHGFAGTVHGGTVWGVREGKAGASMNGVRAGGGIIGGISTVRLRKLSELDRLTLRELDGRSLRELDYIIIEE